MHTVETLKALTADETHEITGHVREAWYAVCRGDDDRAQEILNAYPAADEVEEADAEVDDDQADEAPAEVETAVEEPEVETAEAPRARGRTRKSAK